MTMLHLDLALHPDDIPALLRSPAILTLRGANPLRRERATPLHVIWHDTPDRALATDGVSLAEHRQGRETLGGQTSWRLERMRPDMATLWVPGTPPPIVADAAALAGIGRALPHGLLPVAAFEGDLRTLADDPVRVTLLSGALRAVASERAVARVTLDGPPDAVGDLAHALAMAMRLTVPPVSLAAEALATAGAAPAPRRLGAPSLPPDIPVGTAFAYIVAHLTDVVLHHAALAAAGEAPEPVHQMRVAMRRLRSAVQLFRKAVTCPDLDAMKIALRDLAVVLGPARDWDVFTTGTARAVAGMFEGDRGVARMARRAQRRRDEAYVALQGYLASAAFRRLGLALAILAATQPWEEQAAQTQRAVDTAPLPAELPIIESPTTDAPEPGRQQADILGLDLRRYAARALARRLGRLVAPGADIADLPTAALHAIRLDAKRLRYAAEFFAPLFPGRDTRRFLRRLTVLQERLGHLNDGAVAAHLLEEIGQARLYGGGVVRGFVAAGTAGTREKIVRSWRKFLRLAPFWG